MRYVRTIENLKGLKDGIKWADLDKGSFREVAHVLRQHELDWRVLKNRRLVVDVQHVYDERHGGRQTAAVHVAGLHG